MQEIYKNRLSVLYLSEEEARSKNAEYQKIINELFPNLQEIKQGDYYDLKNRYLQGDEESKKIFQDYALKVAVKELKYIYTHRNVIGYDFYDAIGDACLKVINNLNYYIKADNLFFFTSFVSKNICSKFKNKIESITMKNLDIAKRVEGNTFLSLDNDFIYNNDFQNIEETLIQDDSKKVIDLTLGFLKAKQIKIVKMAYGIGEVEPLSLRKIGNFYKVTSSNVGFVFVKAMKKLRHPMIKSLIKCYGDGNNYFESDKENDE